MILNYAVEMKILETDRSEFSNGSALGKSILFKAVAYEIMV